MSLSFLVAFRDPGDGHRARVWDFVRDRLGACFPDDEVVVGTDDGEDPFHKTLALNRAAAAATGDVFAIWDADTWCPPVQVKIAQAAIGLDLERWWKPWERKFKLDELATMAVLDQGPAWDGQLDMGWGFENRNNFWAAPPVMMSRDAFYAVGAMDERLRGWGGDDEVLAFALKGIFGPSDVVLGPALHLWHPRIGRSGRDLWPGQDVYGPNKRLVSAYQAASARPERMRRLLGERGVVV